MLRLGFDSCFYGSNIIEENKKTKTLEEYFFYLVLTLTEISRTSGIFPWCDMKQITTWPVTPNITVDIILFSSGVGMK